MRDRYHKILFTIGAIWNWMFGLGGIALSIFTDMKLFLPEAPNSDVFGNLFFAMVFAFGIGYYWIGQNTLGNRNIIKMGIIGKLLVFAFVAFYFLTKKVTLFTLLGGSGDFIFSFFFLDVLRKLPKQK